MKRGVLLSMLLTLVAVSPAHAMPDRTELGIVMTPTPVGLPYALGLEAGLVRGRFGAGAEVVLAEPNTTPFWSAWGSVDLVGPLRVFAGAESGVTSTSCPLMPGSACRSGWVPEHTVAMVGVGLRGDFGPVWLDLSPSLALGGPLAFNPAYGLIGSLFVGPPLLELGWRVTPNASVSVRSSVIPLKLAMTF